MSFVRAILERATVQGLREYLLGGCENADYQAGDCEVRLKNAYHKFAEITEKYGITEETELYSIMSEILNTYECSYMEIGIQAGFLLARDMFMNSDNKELA